MVNKLPIHQPEPTRCEIWLRSKFRLRTSSPRVIDRLETDGRQDRRFRQQRRAAQTFIEHGIRTFIANEGLFLAEKHYGKRGILDKWREERRQNNEEWTAEELAEFDEIERGEREKMIADYTPPTDWRSDKDVLNIARFLLFIAENHDDGTGDAEAFNDEFERIMMHRYRKSIVKTEDGKTLVYSRIEPEESEEIITV